MNKCATAWGIMSFENALKVGRVRSEIIVEQSGSIAVRKRIGHEETRVNRCSIQLIKWREWVYSFVRSCCRTIQGVRACRGQGGGIRYRKGGLPSMQEKAESI
eukprot:5187092-Pyramimonas_sp.AAC.2